MAIFTGGPAGAEVNMWLADDDGATNASQVEVARRIARSLPILKAKAADYLDMFVDRTRACGNREEEWWLDEIEFREGWREGTITYAMHFALNGDDGGLWKVYMRANDNEDRPFRFERLQG